MNKHESYASRVEALDDPKYTPHRLLAALARRYNTRSDKHLSGKLGLHPSTISCIRNRKLPFTNNTFIRIMDQLGMSLDEIRELAGLEKPNYEPHISFAPDRSKSEAGERERSVRQLFGTGT